MRCWSPPASGNVDRCPLHDAAPEMLEALRDLLEERGPCHPTHYPRGIVTCVRCRARAAIAKAEGKP